MEIEGVDKKMETFCKDRISSSVCVLLIRVIRIWFNMFAWASNAEGLCTKEGDSSGCNSLIE